MRREMAERKLFLQIQSSNIVYPNVENMIVMPITKGMEIVMSIQVFHILQINFDDKEIGGKKAFLINPKHQCHVSQCEEEDCNANNKNNGDYYEYPSLSHFTDKLRL